MLTAHMLAVLLATAGGQEPAPSQIPDDDEIRRRLCINCVIGEPKSDLTIFGARAFPAYLRILAAKDVTLWEVKRIFGTLTVVSGDRSQFIEYVVAGLASPDHLVRSSAVNLLAQIGGAAEAAPVVALLSDKDGVIPYGAAKTLAAIGDRRTVAAMDVWLNSGNHREDKELLALVAKCRDELKQRLDKPALPGK